MTTDPFEGLMLDFNGVDVSAALAKVHALSDQEIDRVVAELDNATRELTNRQKLLAQAVAILKIVGAVAPLI